VPADQVLEVAEQDRGRSFDAPGATFTHQDNQCTFEVLIDAFDLGGDPALARLARIVHAADIATPTRSGRCGEQLGQPAATARPWRRRQPKAGQGAVVDCAAGGRAAAWPAGVAWLFPRAWHLGSPGRLPVARSSWSTTTRAASRPGPGRALDNPAPCASRGEIKTRKKTDLGTAAGVTTTFALLTREPGG
jgi:hypothetical protein